jgi:hypothetical protein
MKLVKSAKTPMEQLTAGYEQFIKGQELKKNGKGAFNKAIKKAAAKSKQRGAK